MVTLILNSMVHTSALHWKSVNYSHLAFIYCLMPCICQLTWAKFTVCLLSLLPTCDLRTITSLPSNHLAMAYSKKRKQQSVHSAVEWTDHLPPICFTTELLPFEPLRSRHFWTSYNEHWWAPDCELNCAQLRKSCATCKTLESNQHLYTHLYLHDLITV